jgi:GTP-binding protein YchF
VERRLERVVKRARSGEKEAREEMALLEKAQGALAEGKPVRSLELDAEERRMLKGFQLLTSKPVLFVANVAESDLPEGENAWVEALRASVAAEDAGRVVTICSRIEAELAELDADEAAEFLGALGLEEPGLNRLIREAYALLDLITFFTTGENESRAWTVRAGSTAPQAAGTIHTDFERGFIRAETIGYEVFREVGSWREAKEQGKLRSEGKEYTVADGDIMLFRFNV